ncbi:unnamed protein product [Prunus armeniaca]|uniref:Splicing factor SF3a60 /Prp9 subunit C-terminal domain-containing protein n=1 Tax=Prunus armeniaca TaxID=36596 RepID=A0A6J5WPD9_PRUAR|nr:unnamed protein product [Prunus armeniaca]
MATATSAKRVGTHNGSFHCDGALGCKALEQIKLIFPYKGHTSGKVGEETFFQRFGRRFRTTGFGTYEEIKAEPEEQEEIETESHDEENEQQIHNPLKLPLGPDGKIISYWMHKLHGLGQEFKCEICGDSSYFGRRAFEIHFNGECHKRGMRCLGIPKTKSFNEITSIEEAKELWKRIQERQGENLWCPDLGEEHEDEEGNIYNKKTYNDLKRQGLL